VFKTARHWSLFSVRWIQSTSWFYKNHSISILPCTPRSYKRTLSFRLSDQNFVCTWRLSHACRIHRPCHPPWFDYPNNIWCRV